jgi:alpha-glucosidase
MLTIKGTPFLYNGEEIGMTDMMLDNINQFRDNLGVWIYNTAIKQFGMPIDEALTIARTITRDKNRTPMQWANSPNAGFSPPGVETWLPVNPNYQDGVNVAEQEDDPESLLNFYKSMLEVRKNSSALKTGDYQVLHPEAEDYLAFCRSITDQNCLVILNYSNQPHSLRFDLPSNDGKVLFSSQERINPVSLNNFELAPHEILIIEY